MNARHETEHRSFEEPDEAREFPNGRAEAFKALERSGWGQRAETYGLLTGRITARFVEPLLDAAAVVAGTRLLDVGTGPGYAAERAEARGAVATGVDIADEVVALARRRHPEIRFARAGAERLPFPDYSFDSLVANFTINHLPRPERALREFTRVLAPGGAIALSTWDTPGRGGFPGILAAAVRACGATAAADRPAGPDPYRFADDGEFRGLLVEAGLTEVQVRSVSATHRVRDADELWHGMLGGSVRTAGLVLGQPTRVQARIRATVERLAEEYRDDGALLIPATANIARGKKA